MRESQLSSGRLGATWGHAPPWARRTLPRCDTGASLDGQNNKLSSGQAGGFRGKCMLMLCLVALQQVCAAHHSGAEEADESRKKIEGSELSFEYLDLRSLPNGRELCTLEAQNLNLV